MKNETPLFVPVSYFAPGHYHYLKCPYSGFFWSVFPHIWTEYGKIRTRKTPNTDIFKQSYLATSFQCHLNVVYEKYMDNKKTLL